ncbi:hypothetical protein JOD54_006216 [Actinokineospora baliensis]|uniref:ImmA/IrrE family metallo-endopeptidase n=1 Tax=Actinokineospora baliensis TaxID=547056 RepID=UPI00195DF3CE|nr:ImmA/IrrE family metallo-endopeptidase [Actinokineospora baliensis]MBM7776012.1 hypothetical protein [Actinokineospora baliensis]
MTRGKYPNEARSQAFAMIDVLEQRRPGVVERLRVDPLVELEGWDDLAVVYVDEPAGYDRCSVAGSYLHMPPTLRITVAASQRRNGFTGLHELGHHLQKTDITLGGRLFEICPHESETLEEEACDAFAAEILLPDDELRPAIGPKGPLARDVADLFERSSASREACCVWAARQLQGAGVVYLLDADGVVQFAAPHSFIPPARRSDQSGTPLIAAALESQEGHFTRDDTHLRYGNGTLSETLYGQAVWIDQHYLIAIAVRDIVPWKQLAVPRAYTGGSQSRKWQICEICNDFQSDETCESCSEPRCRDGHCGCDVAKARKERPCPQCHLRLAPSRFRPGETVCNDCA